jgi:ribosomal protein L44E
VLHSAAFPGAAGQEARMRIGDDIDDYCSRCKLSTNHSVVSMLKEEVKKVRCRTCNNEHNYRHNKGGKSQMTKQEAFDKVLSSVMGSETLNQATKKKR